MKLKTFFYSLVTLLFLSVLTACGGSASVLDDPSSDNAMDEDGIEVHVDGTSVTGMATIKERPTDNKLKFDPAVVSGGRLVPTGADPLSIVLISSALGLFAARKKRS